MLAALAGLWFWLLAAIAAAVWARALVPLLVTDDASLDLLTTTRLHHDAKQRVRIK